MQPLPETCKREPTSGSRTCVNCGTQDARHHISCAYWRPDEGLRSIGEIACFDKDGMPVIRLYPSAVHATGGAEVFVRTCGVSGTDHGTGSRQTLLDKE